MARRVGAVDSIQIRKHSFAMEWKHLETFSFGDGPDLANRLLELVLSGTKRDLLGRESGTSLSRGRQADGSS